MQSSKEHHFFKIIQHRRRLEIPTSIRSYLGKTLPRTVLLNAPCGKKWPVHLSEDEGQVWFLEGWNEFKKYYSISFGHLLVFKYDGNYQFSVVIFDMSATEIEYPSKTSDPEELDGSEEPDTENGPSVEQGNTDENRISSAKNQANDEQDVTLRMSPLHQRELQTANPPKVIWQSSKELHFFRFIMPSCIHDRRLAIPLRFRSKLGEKLPRIVHLKVPSGKTWLILFREVKGQAWFLNGWNEFVKYYSIAVGYLLVFKYDGKSHFSVVIFDTAATEIEYPN
ncbi:hypothetical protein ACHQM5_023372 [Ranunculus cassubicifolius]